MDEVLLIQECLKGKRKAQGELYRRYAAKMMGVCMRYSRNRDMAHDLLQEGFIKVFTNLNEYSGNGSFEGWMRKIFINCALEKIRRSKVFPLTFPTEETEQETSFPNALEEISAQEMLDLIHRLPPGYQTIFNLFAIEGFSHKEIGAMLRITEGTSRSQYARARYTLQQMIKKFILTMDRRDRFEELFRERLHNWECEPDSEQWKTLAGFLPLRPTRFSTRSIRRTAAIVTLLLLVGGGLLYDRLIPETTTEIVRNRIQPFIVDHIQIPQLTGTVTTDQIADSLLPVLTRKPIYTTGKTISTDKYKSQETKILPIVIASKALETDFSPVLIVRNTKTEPVKVRKASRKWHLGMGGGNFNIAGISSNSAGYPDYACNDHLQGNTPKPPLTKAGTSPISTRTLLSDLKPDKVKHSSPISFGISISRTLSDRWSFNTGLTYSYLRNQWRYESSDYDVLRQRLHMLGIPASFSYRLTHWERFYCYWSAGIVCEVNLSGKIYSAYKSQRRRIPGTLWSANTRIGIAYPIIRHVSVYAEGGFLWNLTPASEIQTIRSEQFFNLTGQIGFRLNF